MTIIPKYENIKADEGNTLPNRQLAVECRLSADADSAIKNVLSVTCDVSASSCEPLAGEITFSGRADFKALYEDAGGAINTLAFYADFADKVQGEGITPLSMVDITLSVVDSSIVSVTPSELRLACVIDAQITHSAQTNIPILSGGEGFFYNAASSNISNFSGSGKGICEVSEEFDVNEIIKKILFSDASVIVTGVNSGVDSVYVEGEAVFRVSYLTEHVTEDSAQESVGESTVKLPFRHEVEAKDVLPGDKAFADIVVKSLKVNAVVDEDKSVSAIEITGELEISIRAYSNNCVSYVDDVFSPQCKLNVTYTPVSSKTFIESFNFNLPIEGVAALDSDMMDAEEVLATTSSRIHIANISVNEGHAVVEGIAVTTVIYRGRVEGENRIASVNVEIPFSETLDLNAARTGDSVKIKAIIYDVDARCRKGRDIDVVMTVKLRADLFTDEVITAISDVEESEAEQGPQSSISIYCPSEKERLWDIAKQLNVSPETVTMFNPELQFPLSSDVRILVYRQKY